MSETTLTHVVREFTTKETAAELRKALRAAFPGVKFYVRMDTGTARGWLSVGYDDGPTHDDVRAVCARFESSRFNGQTDSYDQVPSTLYAAEDGTLYEPRYSCCGINISRHFSPAAEAWAASVAVEGTRWYEWGACYGEPDYYGARRLLNESDLTNGIPPTGSPL